MIGMSNIKANLFTILKNHNRLRLLAFTLGLVLQISVVTIPFMRNIFNTSLLSLYEWIFVILMSMVPLIIHELITNVFKKNL